jgi:ribosomal protein S18 acetylase RimI-like enzyme
MPDKLLNSTDEHLLQVKSWFSTAAEIFTWGGPNMTYPMSDEDFLHLIKGKHLHSYSLLDTTQQVLAFGQFYDRLGRNHLGRLAVAPTHRGKGLSKKLIEGLLTKAQKVRPSVEASLFVFTDNQVAYQCYQSLGFKEVPYPLHPFPGNMQNCVYMVLPNAYQK